MGMLYKIVSSNIKKEFLKKHFNPSINAGLIGILVNLSSIKTKEIILDKPLDNNKEYALLLLKPERQIKTKKAMKEDAILVIEDIVKIGWELNNMIAYDGTEITEKMLRQHYPHFWLGVGENIADFLNEAEKKILTEIYGDNAKNKIIHVLDIINHGGDPKIISDLWSKRYKQSNLELLQKINVLNETTGCSIWGKKRVLFIDKTSSKPFSGKTMAEIFKNVPEEKFFLYNGHVGRMLSRFTEPGNKVLVMLFTRKISSDYDTNAFRQYIVSEIRNKLLKQYYNDNVNPQESVNHEETFVHCTDPAVNGINHIWREIRTWFPEKEYLEIDHYFQPERGPDVSVDIFLDWMNQYRERKYSARNIQRRFKECSFAGREDVARIKEEDKLFLYKKGREAIDSNQVVNLLPAGGTGGRFFGYTTPEHKRIKVIAEKFDYANQQISILEARLRFYLKEEFLVNISVMCNDKNKDFLMKEIRRIVRRSGYPEELISFYHQVGLPRFNPTKKDLLESDKFKEEFLDKIDVDKKMGNKEKERLAYQKIAENGTPGDYFRDDNGQIETKAPGTISILTAYIINGHFREALKQGAQYLMIANGEDLGAVVDPVKIGYLIKQKETDCLAVVTESRGDRGSIIKTENGKLLIAQSEQLPASLSKAKPLLANVNNIYIKTAALLKLLEITSKEFLKLNKFQRLELAQEKIIKKLTPAVEIRPVPVDNNNIRFCGQWTLSDEDIINLMKVAFVYEERDNALYQMKKETDIPNINKRIKHLLNNEVSGEYNQKKWTVVKLPTGYDVFINDRQFLLKQSEAAFNFSRFGLSKKELKFIKKLIYKLRFLNVVK